MGVVVGGEAEGGKGVGLGAGAAVSAVALAAAVVEDVGRALDSREGAFSLARALARAVVIGGRSASTSTASTTHAQGRGPRVRRRQRRGQQGRGLEE